MSFSRPCFFLYELPPVLRGLVFAALLAAILSTSDSYLLVAATNYSNDIYKNVINPECDDQKMLKITKRTTLVLGLGGLVVAIWMQSIMSIWNLASAAYVGGCFIPMLYALFFNNCKKSALAANCAMVVGSVTAVVFEVTGITFLGLPGAAVGTLANFIVFSLITLLDPKATVKSL